MDTHGWEVVPIQGVIPRSVSVKGKGASLIRDHSIINVHLVPRTRHSEKPQRFRDLIVQLVGDRSRIELFARHSTPGWDVWGEEL